MLIRTDIVNWQTLQYNAFSIEFYDEYKNHYEDINIIFKDH